MRIHKAYVSRIYPTARQEQELSRWCRVTRRTYNHGVAVRTAEYKAYKVQLYLLGLRRGWVDLSAKELKAKRPQTIYDVEALFTALGYTHEKFREEGQKASGWKFSGPLGDVLLTPSIEGSLKIGDKYKGVNPNNAIRWLESHLSELQPQASRVLGLDAWEPGAEDPIVKFPRNAQALYGKTPLKDQATAYVSREALADVDFAFDRMVKPPPGVPASGYPKFKAAGKSPPKFRMNQPTFKELGKVTAFPIIPEEAYTTEAGAVRVSTTVTIQGDRIKIQGAGKFFGKGHEWILLARPKYFPIGVHHVNHTQVAVQKRGTHWYLSLTVEIDAPDPKPRTGETLGIDLGKRTFVVDSNAKIYAQEFYLKAMKTVEKLERKKAVLQRRLSRRQGRVAVEAANKNGIVLVNQGSVRLDPKGKAIRQKPSNGYLDVESQVRRIDSKITDLLGDLRHQVTRRLIDQGASTYHVEDLDIKGMMAKQDLGSNASKRMRRVFAKMWAKIGPYAIRQQLTYKATWAGAVVHAKEPQYTSQQCHACGVLNRKLGSNEYFRCQSCGFGVGSVREPRRGHLPENHRDANAAMNLRDFDNPEFLAIRQTAWAERSARAEQTQNSVAKAPEHNRKSAKRKQGKPEGCVDSGAVSVAPLGTTANES